MNYSNLKTNTITNENYIIDEVNEDFDYNPMTFKRSRNTRIKSLDKISKSDEENKSKKISTFINSKNNNNRRNSIIVYDKPNIENQIKKPTKIFQKKRSSSLSKVSNQNDPKFNIKESCESNSSGDSYHERFGSKLGFSSEALKKQMDKRYELKKLKLNKQVKKVIHRKSEYSIDMNILSKLGNQRKDKDNFLRKVLKAKREIDTACLDNLAGQHTSSVEQNQNVFHIGVKQEESGQNHSFSTSNEDEVLESISSVSDYEENDPINQSFNSGNVEAGVNENKNYMFEECSFNIRDRRKSEIAQNLGKQRQLLIEKKKASLNKYQDKLIKGDSENKIKQSDSVSSSNQSFLNMNMNNSVNNNNIFSQNNQSDISRNSTISQNTSNINLEFKPENIQGPDLWTQIMNDNNEIYSHIFTKRRDSTFKPLLSFKNMPSFDKVRKDFLLELQNCNNQYKSFNSDQINNILDRIKMDTKFTSEEIKEIIIQIHREHRIKNAILTQVLEHFPSNFLKDLIDCLLSNVELIFELSNKKGTYVFVLAIFDWIIQEHFKISGIYSQMKLSTEHQMNKEEIVKYVNLDRDMLYASDTNNTNYSFCGTQRYYSILVRDCKLDLNMFNLKKNNISLTNNVDIFQFKFEQVFNDKYILVYDKNNSFKRDDQLVIALNLKTNSFEVIQYSDLVNFQRDTYLFQFSFERIYNNYDRTVLDCVIRIFNQFTENFWNYTKQILTNKVLNKIIEQMSLDDNLETLGQIFDNEKQSKFSFRVQSELLSRGLIQSYSNHFNLTIYNSDYDINNLNNIDKIQKFQQVFYKKIEQNEFTPQESLIIYNLLKFTPLENYKQLLNELIMKNYSQFYNQPKTTITENKFKANIYNQAQENNSKPELRVNLYLQIQRDLIGQATSRDYSFLVENLITHSHLEMRLFVLLMLVQFCPNPDAWQQDPIFILMGHTIGNFIIKCVLVNYSSIIPGIGLDLKFALLSKINFYQINFQNQQNNKFAKRIFEYWCLNKSYHDYIENREFHIQVFNQLNNQFHQNLNIDIYANNTIYANK